MSTPPPDRIKFYVCLPTAFLETRENSYISFDLPAGTPFPSNLLPLMRKTNRALAWEGSFITGVAKPACEGADCACTNCPTPTMICQGEGCKGYQSSTDNLTCNQSTCNLTNNVTYSMKPLYPPGSLLLSEYDPKIRFIKYIPSMDSGSTTMPPSTLPPSVDFAIFSITYPSFRIFNTPERIAKLYETVMQTQIMFQAVREMEYANHNLGVLQKIAKRNNVSTTKVATAIKSERATMEKSANKEKSGDIKKGSMPPSATKVNFNQLGKEMMTMKPGQDVKKMAMTMKPTASKKGSKERYEDDVATNNLVVSTTSEDNPDAEVKDLEVPGPDEFSKELEKDDKKPLLSPDMIMIIVFAVAFVLGIGIMIFFKSKPKKQISRPQQQQQRRRR